MAASYLEEPTGNPDIPEVPEITLIQVNDDTAIHEFSGVQDASLYRIEIEKIG